MHKRKSGHKNIYKNKGDNPTTDGDLKVRTPARLRKDTNIFL